VWISHDPNWPPHHSNARRMSITDTRGADFVDASPAPADALPLVKDGWELWGRFARAARGRGMTMEDFELTLMF